MKRLNQILERWQGQLEIAPVSELFIRVLYLVLFWNMARLLPVGDMIWGPDSLTMLHNPFGGIDQWAMILNVEEVRPYYLWFLIPFLVITFLGMLGIHHTATRIVAWYLFVVLHYGNVEISTGGHHLMQELMFFHIFLFRVPEQGTSKLHSAGRLVHHLSFYAIWIQICLLYFVAGVWKLKGVLWLPGEALLMTLSFKEFGFEGLSTATRSNNFVLIIGNYISLGYQLLFPVLIWVKPIRKWLLFVGALFHLSIAFIVGITDFGLFMVASYAIFIPRGQAARILNRMRMPWTAPKPAEA